MRMDFGTLLNVAQKNENAKQPIACYQTKFAPPKKTAKQNKELSVNIKKFLARREEEERRKVLEEKKKRENLLALRDHKAQSRINKHLKVCKAANKSVLADAVDNENTAVTMAGPSQPDEDDYGYVSQEASAFYNQLMSKYNSMPQRDVFEDTKKKPVKDIASTKDRVKQALKQQQLDDLLGHRRKRKSTTTTNSTDSPSNTTQTSTKDPQPEPTPTESKKEQLKKKKPPPPPINFTELLKIAEKKQHEPIVIEVKPKSEEPERLLTKKQMKEYAKEKEWRERRKAEASGIKPSTVTNNNNNNNNNINNNNNNNNNKIVAKNCGPKIKEKPQQCSEKKKPMPSPKPSINSTNTKINSEKDTIALEKKKLEMERKKLEEMRQALEEEKRKLQLKNSQTDVNKKEKIIKTNKINTKIQEKIPEKPNMKIHEKIPEKLNMKADVMKNRGDLKKPPRPKLMKRKLEEDEYDSELDDFIDDEVEEGNEDYSKCISEIFGYDKSKYKYMDEEEDDDLAMESSFAQQLKEEYVSTKIGIMEDLEDMRMEAMEKKRKAMIKRKRKS